MQTKQMHPANTMQIQALKLNVTSFDLAKAVTFSKIFSKTKLSPSARLVLRCLIDFYNPKKGLVYPGQELISECTGCSIRSVKSAVEELRNFSLVLTVKNKNKLNYHFTNLFFELLEVAPTECKNSTNKGAKSAPSCHEQHETKQINNNSKILNFKKFNNSPEGVNYVSIEKTKKYLDEQKNVKHGSPLDFTLEEARDYLDSLIPELKQTYFARELRKKWNL